MAKTFTQAQFNSLTNANNLMLLSKAIQIPFDATVMTAVANVAQQCGFVPTSGYFLQEAENKPISTLINFILYMGHP